MSWQHSPHRRGALLVLSLRQSYLHQNRADRFVVLDDHLRAGVLGVTSQNGKTRA